MDQCPGDNSMSELPWGHPGAHTGHISNPSLHSLPSQPLFTLWCLFVCRVPGHWKKRFPEHSELDTIPGSDLNIFGGKCCTKTLPQAWDFAPGGWEKCTSPRSWQLELVERGFGQYLTLTEFGAGLPEDHVGMGQTKSRLHSLQ